MRRGVICLSLLVACGTSETCPVPSSDGEPPPPDPRFCELDVTPSPDEVVIAPSASCQSGACLRTPLERELPECGVYPSGAFGLCTGACETDVDCESLEGPCRTGYACAVAVTVGPYCCQPLCICKDFLDDESPPIPATCDAAEPANECCNLDGRAGNSMYPRCS